MVLLLLCAVSLGLNILAICYLRSRRKSARRAFRIPPSLSLEIDTNRPPTSQEWENQFVPIAATTIDTENGETWVKHKEDVLLPGYGPDLPPWDLRRQRIIFN